jgi:2-dehydro-3-deoxyphosphogluconate aldolase/(4S)-4-hydroxy-2-oxoglutarate aldolase
VLNGSAYNGLLEAFIDVPLLGLLRCCPPAQILNAATAATRGGIRVLEITMDSLEVEHQIASVCSALGDQLVVGAGTVMSSDEVTRAVGAGAQFVVSPHFDAEVVAAASDLGVPAVPGVLTPTEIAASIRFGVGLVKLFPAGPMGPDYIRAIRGPFPDIPLLATGGIGPDSIAGFLAAGATAVAVGTSVFAPAVLASGNKDALEERVRAAVASARSVMSS